MFSKIRIYFKFISLIVSLILILSFTACSNKSNDDYDEFYIGENSAGNDTVYGLQSENTISYSASNSKSTVSGKTSKSGSSKTSSKTNASEKSKNNSSKIAASSGKTKTSKGASSVKNSSLQASYTSDSSKTVLEQEIFNKLPDSFENTSVHILMPREFLDFELIQISEFERLTGISVKATISNEKEYESKIISLKNSGNAPDIIVLNNCRFLAYGKTHLQPLDKNTFCLDDDFWYKKYMEGFSQSGRYFALAGRGVPICEGGNYITVYNPSVLNNCGISNMPFELYEEGNWNHNTQKGIINRIFSKNGYTKPAMSFQYMDSYMLSSGLDFVTYNSGSGMFYNNLKDREKLFIINEVWNSFSNLIQNNAVTGWNSEDFVKGETGLISVTANALISQNGIFDEMGSKVSNLKAVPVAGPAGKKAYIPVRPVCLGVTKYGNNIKGSAYFLSYFLDSDNINFNNIFYNDSFSNVYNTVTAVDANKIVAMGYGVLECCEKGKYQNICNKLSNGVKAEQFASEADIAINSVS